MYYLHIDSVSKYFKHWLYRGACAFSTAFALIGAWTGMDIPIQLNDMKGTFATTEPGTAPWQLTLDFSEFNGFQIFFFFWGGVDILEIARSTRWIWNSDMDFSCPGDWGCGLAEGTN